MERGDSVIETYASQSFLVSPPDVADAADAADAADLEPGGGVKGGGRGLDIINRSVRSLSIVNVCLCTDLV